MDQKLTKRQNERPPEPPEIELRPFGREVTNCWDVCAERGMIHHDSPLYPWILIHENPHYWSAIQAFFTDRRNISFSVIFMISNPEEVCTFFITI